MTRSSEDIEREVETARGDLDRTVEALKDKMTPGQMIDELSRSFKGGAAGEMMGNLGAQVRDNPMALAMIGAGMAWLMMGKSDHAASDSAARAYQTNTDPGAGLGLGANGAGAGAGGGLADKVGEAAGGLKDKLAEAAGSLKDKAAGGADQAVHGLQDMGGQAAAVGRKAVRSFEDILQQEPLIVGAFGLAVGVAIGATLPSTAVEDRTFGAARDGLVEAGEKKIMAAAQGLRASGEAAYEAVKTEADHQGLAGGDGDTTLVEKAEAVVRSGVEAARDEFGGTRPV